MKTVQKKLLPIISLYIATFTLLESICLEMCYRFIIEQSLI